MSTWSVACECGWEGKAATRPAAVRKGKGHRVDRDHEEYEIRVRSVVRIDELRREGAADAVLRIVAAKCLLAPYVRADDVLKVLDLERSDLAEALERFKEDARRRARASR